jgi:hypothetical protein
MAVAAVSGRLPGCCMGGMLVRLGCSGQCFAADTLIVGTGDALFRRASPARACIDVSYISCVATLQGVQCICWVYIIIADVMCGRGSRCVAVVQRAAARTACRRQLLLPGT